MRKLTAEIPSVQLLCDLQRVDAAARTAPAALAGGHRAHPGAADAGLHIRPGKIVLHLFDILQPDKGDLYALAARQMHITVPVLLRRLRDRFELLDGYGSPNDPQPHGKHILLFLAHKTAGLQRCIIRRHWLLLSHLIGAHHPVSRPICVNLHIFQSFLSAEHLTACLSQITY